MKRFHISCCGRSGSKYLAKAIRNMGISIIHEMGDDWPIDRSFGVKYFAANPRKFDNFFGIVGWKWALLTPKYASTFEVQFHMVRHPLLAIESATTHADSLFTQIESKLGSPRSLPKGTPEDMVRLGRAINYWIRYNQKFSTNKTLLRVEEFTENGASADLFCSLIDAPKEPIELLSSVSTSTNSRPKALRRVRLDWAMLEANFSPETTTLRRLLDEYGYETAPPLARAKAQSRHQ